MKGRVNPVVRGGAVHRYVEGVIGNVRSAGADGRGGYLRVKPDADQEQARTFLTEERDAAQAEVDGARMPGQLLSFSVPMQMLILTELLLAEPAKPVDLRVLCLAQGHGSGYVSERIEEAVEGLLIMSRQLEVARSL